MKRKFFFRLEINIKNGNGHASRCLKLAKFLKNKGEEVFFVCSIKSYCNLKNFLKKDFEIIKIPNKKSDKLDALLTINNIKKIEKDIENIVLIKDCYFLKLNWDNTIKKFIKKLVIIDDNKNTRHNCDIYINYNIINKKELLYINKKTVYLIGLKYLIIENPKKIKKKKKEFLIYLGNAPKLKLLNKIIKVFQNKYFLRYKIFIVIGNFIKNRKKIKNIYETKNIKILFNVKNFYIYLGKFKFFITAGGVALYESISHDIYPLAISTHLNHKNILQNLNRRGKIFYLEKVNRSLLNNIKKYIDFAKLNKAQKKFFDYEGIKRIYGKINNAKY
jgi:UDP-2,4-diacetamido-2,4,6-trideoxy-beta-L-altropyranose hydrolase